MEDAATIRKAMVQTQELSSKVASGDAQSLNQSCRWISTKDEHANKIISTTAEYFLAQRVVVRTSSLCRCAILVATAGMILLRFPQPRRTPAFELQSLRNVCACTGQARREPRILCLSGATCEAPCRDESGYEGEADGRPSRCKRAR